MIEFSDIVANFSDAARRGRIMVRTRVGTSDIHLAPYPLTSDWAVPCLSFGFLDDPVRHPEAAWTTKEYDALWTKSEPLIREGRFQLPFARCFYAFHNDETAQMYETANLIHLSEEADGVTGEVFSFQPAAPGLMSSWTLQPFQFTFLKAGGISYGVDPAVESSSSPQALQGVILDARAAYTRVMAATLLLTRGQREERVSGVLASANKGRAKAKLAPLPPVIHVRLTRSDIGHASEGSPSGDRLSPRGHERRGHYRQLKGGRLVPVRAASIRGGSKDVRSYQVEK